MCPPPGVGVGLGNQGHTDRVGGLECILSEQPDELRILHVYTFIYACAYLRIHLRMRMHMYILVARKAYLSSYSTILYVRFNVYTVYTYMCT